MWLPLRPHNSVSRWLGVARGCRCGRDVRHRVWCCVWCSKSKPRGWQRTTSGSHGIAGVDTMSAIACGAACGARSQSPAGGSEPPWARGRTGSQVRTSAIACGVACGARCSKLKPRGRQRTTSGSHGIVGADATSAIACVVLHVVLEVEAPQAAANHHGLRVARGRKCGRPPSRVVLRVVPE